ncbi:hypothetical protein M407DRAFT_26363 [Tulasnella calospora MUT 4182]|uniref:MalT-like TPR region domain-containing protein n=1 Tax=Tulasnella calospora MUT 4182 TaxID=1051891 RepID=A0A0C3QFW2_9AGAM|nr:hypothetical protein M407DRAFT_26363 [Tulasnella calospora MUT 4182]
MPTSSHMDGSLFSLQSLLCINGFHREGSSSSVTRCSGLLYALGGVQMGNGVYTKAQEYFQQSLKLAESVGDESGVASAVKAIGDTFYLGTEYSNAEELYIQARDIYSRISDQLGFAGSVMKLGDVYRMRNECPKAEELYIQIRDIHSQIGNQLDFSRLVKKFERRVPNAERASFQAEELYFKPTTSTTIPGIRSALHTQESYIQAREVYSQIGNLLGVARSVYSLGDVYQMRDDYSKAEGSYI